MSSLQKTFDYMNSEGWKVEHESTGSLLCCILVIFPHCEKKSTLDILLNTAVLQGCQPLRSMWSENFYGGMGGGLVEDIWGEKIVA